MYQQSDKLSFRPARTDLNLHEFFSLSTITIDTNARFFVFDTAGYRTAKKTLKLQKTELCNIIIVTPR